MSGNRDPTPAPGEPVADGTRTLTEPGPGSAPPPSSGSLDGARFVPGTVLAGRYRIVGLLGRGGMGEVYRAEDLKLGEPVALKFLPAELSLDGAALARFHREVRVARNVAHRNVCRVFDIGEAGGLHFLSMEYIDGEDLSSLLRRIGRAPREKAVELARQICAGLGAAHEAGVLHRDMKPANVMVDGKGRAKITDFGLAQVAEELQSQDIFAGTPAYMAPEQITSGEVSVRTDLYALGLVLYEMFTGRRAFPDEDWRELMGRGGHGEVSRPSSHIEGLDPLIERVVMRCLEEEPSARPRSALEVSAALPGGDPLAAALAAGETPSPEMVAAAPEKGTLKPRAALACFAGLVVLLLALVPLAEQTRLVGLARLPKSPQVLADRAATLASELSDTAPAGGVYRHGGWWTRRAYMRHLRQTDAALDGWEALKQGRPPAMTYWYRQSPSPLHPRSGNMAPSAVDPPLDTPGMVRVELDPTGRLVGWRVGPRLAKPSEAAPSSLSWARFFAEAGLDPATFESSEPRWVLPLPTDQRLAWEGAYPQRPELEVRVEAGAFRGRPVYFEVAEPWDGPRGRLAPSLGSFGNILLRFIIPFWTLTLLAGVWLARRHLASGRADRRGATRLSVFVFACLFLSWGLGAHHSSSVGEFSSFQNGLAEALLWAAYCGVVYLALEPFLRRRWPEGLISWNRLLAGRFRDPLVGRDVLIGGLLGAGAVLTHGAAVRTLQAFGRPFAISDDLWSGHLLGLRSSASTLLSNHVFIPLFNALALALVFHLLVTLLRRKGLATLALILMMMAVLAPSDLVELPFSLIFAGLLVLPVVRFGLLTTLSFWSYFFLLRQFPMTTDLDVWYAGETVFAVGLAGLLGFWGFRTALAGQRLFGRSLTTGEAP
ncbi:MAG: serine/threonine protein kinase [bacterium]|nr:serine/threonine protein kinase [bacterium]